MAKYMKLSPNCKLPPKYHESSLLAVHHGVKGGIFQGKWGITPSVSAMKWAGIIRMNLTKWRDLKHSPTKLAVIQKIATLHDLFVFSSVGIFAYVHLLHIYKLDNPCSHTNLSFFTSTKTFTAIVVYTLYIGSNLSIVCVAVHCF